MPAIGSPAVQTSPDWAERAERIVTTLLIGKLVCQTGAELCRIRNISSTGMLIETSRVLRYGNSVAVELRCGQRLQGTVAWSSTGRAGVQFLQPIDVDEVLAVAQANAQQRSRGTTVPRAPRFDVTTPARISINGRTIDVVVENVSQSGACLRLPRPPRQDTQMILSVPGLPTRRCVTRWADEERAGVSFLDVIPYQDLSGWLGHLGSELI